MSNRIECNPQPEYVYVTIPAEYVCVYHKILAMLADYGEEMLKDCKASCTDKNSGVIECYNMFNAAVAARSLGQEKKATLIINYIKAKINQIYRGKENNPGYVFPIDEKGRIKAFVSCNDRPRFWINSEDGVLYKKAMDLGYAEDYYLDKRDKPFSDFENIPVTPKPKSPFDVYIKHNVTENGGLELNLEYYLNGELIEDVENITTDYYFDKISILGPEVIDNMDYGKHLLVLVCEYKKDKDTKYLITKRDIITRKFSE